MLLSHPSQALATGEKEAKPKTPSPRRTQHFAAAFASRAAKREVVHLNQISPERLADVMRGSKSMIGHEETVKNLALGEDDVVGAFPAPPGLEGAVRGTTSAGKNVAASNAKDQDDIKSRRPLDGEHAHGVVRKASSNGSIFGGGERGGTSKLNMSKLQGGKHHGSKSILTNKGSDGMRPAGSKNIGTRQGSKATIVMSRQSSKRMMMGSRNGQLVRYVKAPRPRKPWEADKEARKSSKRSSHHRHHSRWHHFLATFHVVDESESDWSDSQEEQWELPPHPRKNWLCRFAVPFSAFLSGTICLIVFLAGLANMMPRKESTCEVTGFKRGLPCESCQFEVAVAGVTTPATFQVQFGSDGFPLSDAFENCSISNGDCCLFQTRSERGISEFCDDAPWPCTYTLSNGKTPENVESGSMITMYYMLLASGLILIFVLLPCSMYHSQTQEQDYDEQLAKAKEVTQSNVERDLEMNRLEEEEHEIARAAQAAKRGAVVVQMAQSSQTSSFGSRA
ncbi:unnamed protein product [Amoebophrya sp. A25]|nr:unnamed protein product [Amoebophrya sp. A25]|eukprot:GSA25T00010130001.1